MGGYKQTVPTVYMVGWRDLGIVKVGYSASQRWRPFLIRGAELLSLEPFSDYSAAFDREEQLHSVMRDLYPPAFASKDQAEPILGKRGSGYSECYTAPVDSVRRFFDGR